MNDVEKELLKYEDANDAIAQGRRHLLVNDYNAAVTAFASGCQLLARKHGDFSDELGEPYLYYGRALLYLSREEAGVLGLGVPGTEDAEEAGDGEDDDEEEETAEGDKDQQKAEETPKVEKEATKAKAEKPKAEEKPEAKKPAANASKSTEKPASESASATDGSSAAPAESSAGGSGSGQDKMLNGEASTSTGHRTNGISHDSDDEVDDESNEEDEESTNLQLAWEVLELAKLIILKRGDKGWKHLAEAHRLLGEVAMESGNQVGALADLNACMELLERLEPRDPRGIAETHYQLGLAYSLGNEFDSSIEQFQKATTLLENRITELEALGDKAPDNNEPGYTVAGEIKELKELLPEIRDKIADMKDFKQEACKMVIEKIKNSVAAGSCSNGAGPSTADGASSSSSSTVASASDGNQEAKPVSDISHLVRKKRKPEDETESPAPCKKATPDKV